MKSEKEQLNFSFIHDFISASGSDDHKIQIWDLAQQKELYTLGYTDWVWCLAFLNNNRLASGSRDGQIKVWDLTERRELYSLNGHTRDVWCIAVLNKNQLASVSNKSIKIWDLSERINCLCIFHFHCAHNKLSELFSLSSCFWSRYFNNKNVNSF